MGFAVGAAAVAAAFCAPTMAQQQPAQNGTATKVEKAFDGWLVTCLENANGKRCSMRQTRVMPKTKQVVFAWTVVAGQDKKLVNVLTTPTGVSLQDGIRLSLGQSEPVQVSYSACGPRICQGTMPLDDALLQRLEGNPKVAVNFVLANKRLVQTEIDLKGFSNAYAYMTDQLN